jgi:malonate-semialdehyde dehydrogenase (acetylating) / methylmalonate-semialdehyde dehydrogenase
MTHRTHWINGKPWTGEAATRGDIYNPATGRVSGTVDYATKAEVDAAVAAAAAALPGWRETSLVRRAAVMFAFRELLVAHRDELAARITAGWRWWTSPAGSRTW